MRPRRLLAAWLWPVVVLLQPGCILLPQAEPAREQPQTLATRDTARLCVAVGDSLAGVGHVAEAIAQYEKARQLDPKAEVTRPLARLYAAAGEEGRARDEYHKALEGAPRDANLWNDFGYFQYNLGDWKGAGTALHKAVELDPHHARAWINLGLTLGQQQQYQESLAAFEKAVSPAEARCNLGFVLATQGKLDEAREAYQSALTIDPQQRLARTGLARLARIKAAGPTVGKPVEDGKLSQAAVTNRPPE